MILLDTQVALWLLYAPERVGKLARQAIEEAEAVAFSAVSIAEITVKKMLGRLDVPDDVARQLERSGLTPLALDIDHAAALDVFSEFVRHDPFDRLILAQARVERATLLTADRVLLSLDLPRVDDARR